MGSTRRGPTTADVAGWGSAVVTFGLIQGALNLKAYWGHFGLDPFQFVAVSELALAGLAGRHRHDVVSHAGGLAV